MQDFGERLYLYHVGAAVLISTAIFLVPGKKGKDKQACIGHSAI